MVSVLMLTLLLSLIISVSAQEDLKRSIQIINPRPIFSVTKTDKGTGATYAPGESIRVSFRSSRNAYVAIFSYDSFEILLFFPNQNQKDHFVEANKTI